MNHPLDFEAHSDRDEEYYLRVRRVLNEYPFLQPIVASLSIMDASETEWIAAAEEINKGPFSNKPEVLGRALVRDPNFPAKYRFIMTSAIIDNKSIPTELKHKIVEIAFKSKEKDNHS